MRSTLIMFALVLAGCASDVDGVHVSGIAPIHADEVRAALAAARAGETKTTPKVYALQVINATEMHAFRGSKEFPGFELLRKFDGKWKSDGTVVWTELGG